MTISIVHPASSRLRIIKPTEAIPVTHPAMLVFGPPGICKTSLGYSADAPLLLDCDMGAHRAINRRDTMAIESYADIERLLDAPEFLAPYKTIVVDTVGRLLDLLTLAIIEDTPKYARDGNLTQQGWGVLKGRFRTLVTRIRALDKDPLFIAHVREDKDGDVTQMRPDIQGGSYGEVLKSVDFVGYVSMVGKNRVLDFSPTDRWVGKNPAGWRPIHVPPPTKATSLLAELFAEGRQALGGISDEAARVVQQLEEWRLAITEFTTAEEINRAIPQVQALSPVLLPQVKRILVGRATALACTWDVARGCYTSPAPLMPPPPINGTETRLVAAQVSW